MAQSLQGPWGPLSQSICAVGWLSLLPIRIGGDTNIEWLMKTLTKNDPAPDTHSGPGHRGNLFVA